MSDQGNQEPRDEIMLKAALAVAVELDPSIPDSPVSDDMYPIRNAAVMVAARLAERLGHRVAWEGDDAQWFVQFVWLPEVGQVSWRLPYRDCDQVGELFDPLGAWDGHTTTEKARRVRAYLKV